MVIIILIAVYCQFCKEAEDLVCRPCSQILLKRKQSICIYTCVCAPHRTLLGGLNFDSDFCFSWREMALIPPFFLLPFKSVLLSIIN